VQKERHRNSDTETAEISESSEMNVRGELTSEMEQ